MRVLTQYPGALINKNQIDFEPDSAHFIFKHTFINKHV